MFQWIKDLYEWITSLPDRALDAVLSPAADYIDSLSPITSTPALYFANVTNDFLQLATLLGVPQGLTIIGSAYLIRFGLQLIPLIRLGS